MAAMAKAAGMTSWLLRAVNLEESLFAAAARGGGGKAVRCT